MKKTLLQFKILPMLFLSIAGFYKAQQSTLAAGTTTHSTAGSVSYSVGQVFYESMQSGAGKVNPGVQQPYEIFVLATQENANQNSITIYPNPVKDFLIVDLSGEKFKNPTYQLFDGTGRIISIGELKNRKTEINTSTLSSGLYILSVLSEGKTIKTFKIIKN